MGGICPESSRVEFLEKVSALETEETAVVPSGRRRGGKDEEVKLLEIFLARCQKEREELEEARF